MKNPPRRDVLGGLFVSHSLEWRTLFILIEPFPAVEPEAQFRNSQHHGGLERSGLFLPFQTANDGRLRIDGASAN